MANEERRPGGRETWHRLLDWDRGQPDSERLAARILLSEGYTDLDPSHPLGGRDGGKDAICKKEERTYCMAAFFPRGQQSPADIRSKFKDDSDAAKGIRTHKVEGIAFVTNQEMTLAVREELREIAKPLECEIFHLERMALILDTPKSYGQRLEFLGMEMTKAEQVSFINDRDSQLSEVTSLLNKLLDDRDKTKKAGEIKTVSVVHHDSISATTFGSKLISCIKCSEIFRVSESSLITKRSLSLFNGGITETVTCPECGKIQAYKSSPW